MLIKKDDGVACLAILLISWIDWRGARTSIWYLIYRKCLFLSLMLHSTTNMT